MGVFDKRIKNTTLMVGIILFEDFDHQRPVASYTEYKGFAEPIVVDVLRAHYFEELRPPKKWNWDLEMIVMDSMTSPVGSHYDVRDPETKEVADKASYKEMCSGLKNVWKDRLLERFPRYDRTRFEDTFETVKYTYLKERCVLAASVLMEDIMQREDDFRPT